MTPLLGSLCKCRLFHTVVKAATSYSDPTQPLTGYLDLPSHLTLRKMERMQDDVKTDLKFFP